MKNTVEGLYGIKATVLCDSISQAGIRMLTFEIEYPRLILAELNTHRVLSKNSFSSRAVPFTKMVKQLDGRPVRFGANQAGMQDSGEHNTTIKRPFFDDFGKPTLYTPTEAWEAAKEDAIGWAEAFSEAGYHKQVFNRLLEPWQMMKTVISGTEWANLWWLRDHDAADPTFHELVRCMRIAKDASTPETLIAGEWHLPYVDIVWVKEDESDDFRRAYFIGDIGEIEVSLEEAIKVSCARCAAVSYRNEGYNLAKSIEVYEKLVGADRKHASAFEHQATPLLDMRVLDSPDTNIPYQTHTWQPGITHMDHDGNLWSGNIKGFIQFRKLIPGENYVE